MHDAFSLADTDAMLPSHCAATSYGTLHQRLLEQVDTPRDLKVLQVLRLKVSPPPNGHFPPLTLRCGMVLRLHVFAASCSINRTCARITKLVSFVIFVQVPFMLQIAAKPCKR